MIYDLRLPDFFLYNANFLPKCPTTSLFDSFMYSLCVGNVDMFYNNHGTFFQFSRHFYIQ